MRPIAGISGGRWWSLGVIGCHWVSLGVIECHWWSLVVIGGHRGSLGVIECHWWSLGGGGGGHWWSLRVGGTLVVIGGGWGGGGGITDHWRSLRGKVLPKINVARETNTIIKPYCKNFSFMSIEIINRIPFTLILSKTKSLYIHMKIICNIKEVAVFYCALE